MDLPRPAGKEKVAYSGRIFKIVRQPMKIGGKIIEFEKARRSPGTRLIVIKDDKILVIKEYRIELKDYDYRMPGGKVFDTLEEYQAALDNGLDIGKAAIKAAKKECLEEAGIIAKDIDHHCTTKAGATVEWDLYYFIVRDFDVTGQSLEEGEIIETEWKNLEEIKKMCLNNSIKEDRTVGVLLRFLEVYRNN